MSTAERYTLDEARELLKQEECGIWGHDFSVLYDGNGEPHSLMCGRCGASWHVGERDG